MGDGIHDPGWIMLSDPGFLLPTPLIILIIPLIPLIPLIIPREKTEGWERKGSRLKAPQVACTRVG